MPTNSRPTNSEASDFSIPDPWEDTPATSRTQPWQFQPEAHPSIGPASSPEISIDAAERPGILRLRGPKTSGIEVLLEDGLKLKAYAKGQLKAQLEQALTLLAWLNEKGQTAIA